MKKIWIVAALAACAIALAGCKIVSDPEPEPIAVQSVTLNETALTLEYGETRTLTATVLPLNADNRRVTWSSSDTEVVWVTWDGTITAYNEGTAIIIAQAGDKIATCTVTVKRQPVSANWITLNETSLWLRRNESRILTVTVHPENADDKLATWTSSDTGVATVDNNGIVTAVAAGTAIITARVGSVDASCAVYVNEEDVEQPDYPGAVESVTLNTETLMLAPGSTGTLVATVHPDDAIDKTVIWRAFNPYIATVDDDGNVTAVSEGSTFITAIVGGKTAECEVIVERISVPVDGITLDHETLTINRREEGKLTAMVTPSNADCTTVIWTSSNDEIAFVDYWDGIVVAKKVGTVTITATTQEGGFTATCEVTVNPRPIENITFDKTTLALAPGETGELQYTIMPDDLDYNDDRTVIWSSSDETIATVSRLSSYDKSKITALKVGKATITATAQAGGKTATCEVIVHNHSFTDGKCTVCGKNPYMGSGTIDENGVLTKVNTTNMPIKLVIPEGVTGIGNNAFKYFSGLTGVTIPDSVKYIGNNAFYACYNLEDVEIPNSVTSIGAYAFYDCVKFNSMTIPASVKSIGDGAFYMCGLTSVKMDNGVTTIGSSAFEKCGWLNSVEIPASVKSIGSDAFKDCTNLTKIQFKGTKAQWYAIEGSDKIDITCILCSDGHIGIDVEKIPEYLKISRRTVTGVVKDKLPAEIEIPNGVTSIGFQAFYRCTELTSVEIPNSVTSIGNGAFIACNNIRSMTIPGSVTSIGDSAFSGCKGLTSMIIPNSVTSIGDSAFFECTSLTSITIPSSVTSIGRSAFCHCSKLGSVTIPNSVTSIEESTFSGCTSLTSITIPASVTSIGNNAFFECTSLTSVTIPNSVTSIGNNAFSRCTSLTSVTIPASVTSIGEYSFNKCENLKTVIYKGTKVQWEAISKGGGYTTIGSFTVKCTDGTVVAK